MKQKKIMLMAVTMSIVLSLSACGSDTQVGSSKSTETVAEATETAVESVEESTETFVLENELSTEESTEESVDATETEASEPVEDDAGIKTTLTDKTESTGYTYTEDSRTMYAKSTVTVRSLPSTSGSKLGSLSKNQEVAVTGQCNETGWYRIAYADAEGFVSDKYLTDEPVAKAASVAQAQAGAKTNSSTSTGDPVTDAAIAKYGPNIMIFDDGTIFSTETWEQVGTINDVGSVSDYTKPADGYNRTIAEQVWAKVNAERTAAGLNALAWDETAYNFACGRAQALVTNYSHNGNASYYGENICQDRNGTAESIHMQWYNSPGHHENYMNTMYGSGACAVYGYNGIYYCVETFALASSPQTDPYASNQTREVNGETVDLSGQQAEAVDNGNYWTASNGIVVYVESNGNLSCNAVGDEATAALLEYIDTH